MLACQRITTPTCRHTDIPTKFAAASTYRRVGIQGPRPIGTMSMAAAALSTYSDLAAYKRISVRARGRIGVHWRDAMPAYWRSITQTTLRFQYRRSDPEVCRAIAKQRFAVPKRCYSRAASTLLYLLQAPLPEQSNTGRKQSQR